MARVSDLGEFELIARLRRKLNHPGPGVVIGIGDDATALEPPRDKLLLFTTDTLVEGIHFRLDWTSPEDLGWKALAQNVSDIAAMGGTPSHALISLACPSGTPVDTVERLYAGLAECVSAYRASIVGGDTVHSPGPMIVTVALLGEVEREQLITRSGAQVGDAVLVTGELGAAAAGVMLLESGEKISDDLAEAVRRQHRPTPRLAEAGVLAQSGLVNAMVDVSDGLGSDLRRICEESSVGARVELKRVPVSPLVRYTLAHLDIERNPVEVALSGGEDFELLLTASPDHVTLLQQLMSELKTPLTVVGQIMAKQSGVMAIAEGGEAIQLAEGYTHFRSGEAHS